MFTPRIIWADRMLLFSARIQVTELETLIFNLFPKDICIKLYLHYGSYYSYIIASLAEYIL